MFKTNNLTLKQKWQNWVNHGDNGKPINPLVLKWAKISIVMFCIAIIFYVCVIPLLPSDSVDLEHIRECATALLDGKNPYSLEIVENNFKMDIGIEKHLIVYNKVIKAKNEFHKIKYLNKSDVSAVITDLDRTITDRPGKPEFDPVDFDKELLNDLKNLGIDLILATGRNIY
jgi:hypothetical protein